jgi:imidazolonepropionase-like amidohydrolase
MLGALDPGYEASFLVLGGDPVADLMNLERIAMRVKQGIVLPPMAGPVILKRN